MDIHENLTMENAPARAQRKHVVLFVIACVMMAGLLFFFLPALLELLTETSSAPSESVESQLPGGEVLAGVLVAAAYAMAELILLVGFGLCWGLGQVVSALLAMDKRNKPRWLWAASLALAVANGAVLVVMAGIWFLA